MSGSPHTPGPWVIDDRPIYDEAAGLNAKPVQRGACIATVETAWSMHSIHAPATIGQPCPSVDDMNAQGLANAHLIAAAPELLEAARLVDRIERLYDYRPQLCARTADFANSAESRIKAKRDLEDINLELREIRADIAAAIAKAEGRA